MKGYEKELGAMNRSVMNFIKIYNSAIKSFKLTTL